jgi:hypothetical protein
MISDTVNPSALRCTTSWHRPADVVAPATDDHPFVYLDGNTIPWIYRITLGLILLASILLVRPAAGPYRRMRGYADLFFMGAAFMLLETKNIVQFALLFGTTWFVNALVTAGVLVAVFAAVEVSRHVIIRRPALLYAALLVALIVAWAIPPSSLLSLSPLPRFFAAVVIAFAPIFLANMVFAQRFRDTEDTGTAFGANLLGAMVGGVLEYASLIVGYRWLLVFVALLYGLAFLTGWRHLRIAGLADARCRRPRARHDNRLLPGSLAAQFGGQGLGQGGGAELVPGLLQSPGRDPGAGQQFDGGLAHGQAQRRGGHPQPGQVPAARGGGERGGELGVRDRGRGGEVDRAADVLAAEQERERGDLVGQRDPAHDLAAGGEPGQDPQPGQREHPGEQPAARREDQAAARVHDPDAGVGGRLGGRLPVPDQASEEGLPGRRGLVDLASASVAVPADGRGRHQGGRRRAELG